MRLPGGLAAALILAGCLALPDGPSDREGAGPGAAPAYPDDYLLDPDELPSPARLPPRAPGLDSNPAFTERDPALRNDTANRDPDRSWLEWIQYGADAHMITSFVAVQAQWFDDAGRRQAYLDHYAPQAAPRDCAKEFLWLRLLDDGDHVVVFIYGGPAGVPVIGDALATKTPALRALPGCGTPG